MSTWCPPFHDEPVRGHGGNTGFNSFFSVPEPSTALLQLCAIAAVALGGPPRQHSGVVQRLITEGIEGILFRNW
ncbi:MAG: hypothetical protein JRG83_19810 [Deltaproteobacteria bacterium]|nr:hypothetical protein [Deltaproteobacteria bacterium]